MGSRERLSPNKTGWGDGSVGKVPAAPAQGSEFSSLEPETMPGWPHTLYRSSTDPSQVIFLHFFKLGREHKELQKEVRGEHA